MFKYSKTFYTKGVENAFIRQLFAERGVNSTWWHQQMEHFPRYWHFVSGIHRLPVDSVHKGQWRRALCFSKFDLRLNKRLNKQSRHCWFETPSRPLWLHCNEWFLQSQQSRCNASMNFESEHLDLRGTCHLLSPYGGNVWHLGVEIIANLLPTQNTSLEWHPWVPLEHIFKGFVSTSMTI